MRRRARRSSMRPRPGHRQGEGAPVEAGSRSAARRRRASAALSERCRSWDASASSSCWRGSGRRCASERRPHLVTVIGPAGIGKSRLAEEFARFGRAQGGVPFRGRSRPYGDSSAYGAFAQQVKQVGGIFDNDDARRSCARSSAARATRRRADREPRAACSASRSSARSTARAFSSPRGSSSRASRATGRPCSSSRTSTGPTRACST